MKKLIAASMASLLLVACGKTLDGTYSDSTGIMKMTFSGNKVETMGTELEYKIEDGKLKIKGENGAAMVFHIEDDQTLTSSLIGTLKKE